MWRGLRLYEAPLFARDLLKNDEEIPIDLKKKIF
jgi:hypothetical protein